MWLLPDSTADFPCRFNPFSNSYSSSDPTSLLGRHSTDIQTCAFWTNLTKNDLSSVLEVTGSSRAEYCEKLQQRRSIVARLGTIISLFQKTLGNWIILNSFDCFFMHLQPLWSTTKSKGLTKEWTKATWRETCLRWCIQNRVDDCLSPHETLTSWHPSTPSSSWQGWPRREGPRRWGRPPWSPGTSSPSPPPPAPSSWCTPWCCWREGLSPSQKCASWSWLWRDRQSSPPQHS